MNPHILIRQLGGHHFIAMTGAKNFTHSKNTVGFRLGRGAMDSINYVKVTLDPSDTYTMTFMRIRGAKVTVVGSASDVYCDQLQTVFTDITGLYTTL